MIFARVTLLGTFSAAGVALALCLGLLQGEGRPPGGDAQAALGAHIGATARPAESAIEPESTASEKPRDASSEPSEKQEPTPDSAGAPADPLGGESPAPNPLSKAADSEPPAPLPAVPAPPPAAPMPPGPTVATPYGPYASQAADPSAQDHLLKVIEHLADRLGPNTPTETVPPPLPAPAAPPAEPPVEEGPTITRSGAGEGDGQLRMQFTNSDIREVLDALAAAGNLNILASNSVQGTVSATLNGVSIDSALDAILRSTGYIARREANFIYVGTPEDFKNLEQSLDAIGTRVYRPNYITAAELQTLVEPLLTAGVGVVSVSTPAEQGIEADNNDAGGDSFAGNEVVLVRDYEAVLAQIDQVVAEVDIQPPQVAIEAMILSVKLSDGLDFGVDFELLRNKDHAKFGWGQVPTHEADSVTLNNDVDVPTSALIKGATTTALNGGLKFGFLDDSLGAFLDALESIGETSVIATPRLMVLNKHRADVLIGEQLGYVSTTMTETSSSQSVEFLEVGAQLRLRPFISNEGLIRMEVHPELSTGSVQVKEGFTLPNKETTQVTTNIIVPDGSTMVIGGLMREDLKTTTSQVPYLGSLPWVGVAFRNKHEETERREIIVLITPHIVRQPIASIEGDEAACEFHRRQAVYAEKMSPLTKQSVSRSYLRRAQQAWAAGDRRAALRFAEMAVQFDPSNRAAIDLRSSIWVDEPQAPHAILEATPPAAEPVPPGAVMPPPPDVDGADIAPWVLEDLEGSTANGGNAKK